MVGDYSGHSAAREGITFKIMNIKTSLDGDVVTIPLSYLFERI